ncbi:MAG: DUF2784 domain-containing protein [Gemmatimonadota bacterium]|nr:MAG: DUF2784 domain-containing protein [Gemmatimonadota bacterium]
MLLHFGFVIFVIAGGLLVLWRPRFSWLHIPCALYGAAIELFGWVCPLTPLEQSLRRTAGQGGYEGGFIEHYVRPILYPANWRDIHVLLGIAVVVVNVGIYVWVWRRLRRQARREAGLSPR